MARFVLDAGAVIQVVSEPIEIAAGHELLAPTLLRSQVLSKLHEAVQRGDLEDEIARARLDRIGRLPIRLLGDAVLRRRAWEIASDLRWGETYVAEYLALTQLQGDAFITTDTDLAHRVAGIVTVAPIDALSLEGGGWAAPPKRSVRARPRRGA